MKWLRSIHLASVGTFGGALVTLLVLGSTVDVVSPTSFAAVRQAMTIASQSVAVPALLLALLSGLLLIVARPAYIDARWVWAKVALGAVIGWVMFAEVQPAMNRATGHAVQAAIGAVLPASALAGAHAALPMDAALEHERRGRWINLGLVVAATALSVWRPRLGGRAVPGRRPAAR
jgi:outer membrane lipoprotein SlyB